MVNDSKGKGEHAWPNLRTMKGNLREAVDLFPDSVEDIICHYWMDLEFDTKYIHYSNSLSNFWQKYLPICCRFLCAVVFQFLFSMLFPKPFSWSRLSATAGLCVILMLCGSYWLSVRPYFDSGWLLILQGFTALYVVGLILFFLIAEPWTFRMILPMPVVNLRLQSRCICENQGSFGYGVDGYRSFETEHYTTHTTQGSVPEPCHMTKKILAEPPSLPPPSNTVLTLIY